MSVTTVVRPGQVNATGDAGASLLTLFAGEVLQAFEETNVMMGLSRVKTVTGGAASWTFPVLGTAGTKYHTPGENLLTDAGYLQTIRGGERKIHADKTLTSPVFLDKLDRILNHWDARAEYSLQLGRALAKQVDINMLRVLWEAAYVAADALFTGSKGGHTIVDADGDSNGESFIDAIFRMGQSFDESDVPSEGRYILLSPAQMRLLFTTGSAVQSGMEWVSADFNAGGVNGGGMREGKIPRIAGFDLVVTNHIDTGTGTKGDATNQYSSSVANDYAITIGSGEDIVAMAMQREAIGTVKLQDVQVQQEYKIEYQGDIVVASLNVGHGILRPECAGIIAKA